MTGRTLLTALMLVTLTGCTGTAILTGADPVDTTPIICAPGERVCRTDEALVCSEDGTEWLVEECAEHDVCVDGYCTPPAAPQLVITSEVLPVGEVGTPYEAGLNAEGGTPPYTWTGVEELPEGLEIFADGIVAGTPEQPDDHVITVQVTDADGTYTSRDLALTIHPEPISILTDPDLGLVDEGVEMSRTLEASGGVPPYGWFVLDGALPQGVSVDAAGGLTGIPLEPGHFDFVLRVVDAEEPPGWGEQDFGLTVELRPLEIYGDQMFDILGFAIVTLPMLTIIPNIPLPYDTQLLATGGLQPYDWVEQPLPTSLEWLIPQSGIPQGLELQPDGLLTGSVTDTSQVITLTIPFTGISMTGFFFFAEVSDSQEPADTDTALFLIPTLPIEL
jgi:hypothetical protein